MILKYYLEGDGPYYWECQDSNEVENEIEIIRSENYWKFITYDLMEEYDWEYYLNKVTEVIYWRDSNNRKIENYRKEIMDLENDILKKNQEILNMKGILRERIIEKLKENTCRIVFEKVDGSRREVIGTLREDMITYVGTGKKTVNTDIISFWSVDDNGWRSFRLDNFIKVEVI